LGKLAHGLRESPQGLDPNSSIKLAKRASSAGTTLAVIQPRQKPERNSAMNDVLDRSVWINYFYEFNKRNCSRPTQLEVFGVNGAQTEECGLPFAGISFERNGAPDIEIMFGNTDAKAAHLTHFITDVRAITPKRGPDGRDEALAIVGASGEMSLLRFEPRVDSVN
jgi:hypothetical protein